MSKRSDIGDNPLDNMIPYTPTKQETKEKKRAPQKGKSHPAKQLTNALKERLTIQISKDVVEKTKDAVYWTPGLTVAQLTEEALIEALKKLEKRNGESFPNRKEELKP